jgi:hypothetical protein
MPLNVGDIVKHYGATGTVVAVHGKAWVKVAGFHKQWWKTSDLAAPALKSAVDSGFTPFYVPTAPTTIEEAVTESAGPPPLQQPVEIETWVPATPGAVGPGLTVGVKNKLGQIVEATCIGQQGKAWIAVDVTPKWRKTVECFVKQLVLQMPDGAVPAWDPGTPSWSDWKSHFTLWYGKLTQLQKNAISEYTGAAYGPINKLLRAGANPHTSPYYNVIKALDSALASTVSPFDVTLYRSGTRKFDLKTQVGSIITDLGFVSTSTDLAFAKSWNAGVFMEIRCRKGSRAAYVYLHSSHKNEREVMLPRGSQFRVVSVEKQLGAKPHVVLELLPITAN